MRKEMERNEHCAGTHGDNDCGSNSGHGNPAKAPQPEAGPQWRHGSDENSIACHWHDPEKWPDAETRNQRSNSHESYKNQPVHRPPIRSTHGLTLDHVFPLKRAGCFDGGCKSHQRPLSPTATAGTSPIGQCPPAASRSNDPSPDARRRPCPCPRRRAGSR